MDQPASDRHDRAIRWRQLVDLLARSGTMANSPFARVALEVVRADRHLIDEDLRASAARATAALPLPFELILFFASDDLKVSAPVLAAANLEPEQWRWIVEEAGEETRKFILALHPDVGPAPKAEAPSAPAITLQHDLPSISDVIARIERMREARQEPEATPSAPGASPEPAASTSGAGEPSMLFRWEATPDGEFAWVEGAPRGALIGRPLFDAKGVRVSGRSEIARAFTARAPFRNAVMTLGDETVLAGDWQVSGVPAFEHSSGRFAGYRGIAKRVSSSPRSVEPPHPDSLRELVHEIKTPLNAIMGFAEIIAGEMFGPAEQPYRERASKIVAQSHLLLTAIDDLDLAAKSSSHATNERALVDLGELVERIAPQLRKVASKKGVQVDDARGPGKLTAAIEPSLADRLIWRMCTAVVDRAEPGERLRLFADEGGDRCRVAITRAAALRGVSDDVLFGPASETGHASWLRLTRGLAQMAGADLITSPDEIALTFVRPSLGSAKSRVYGGNTGPVAQR
ncbi:MAG: sensor histidine kinase [Sphingomicrobium sp.]